MANVKIGVFSDTHDNLSAIGKAVELFNGEAVELVIHAGDFISPFSISAMEPLNCSVVGVFGNNDGERIGVYNRFQKVGKVHNNLAEIELEERKIAVMHYPELAEPIAASGLYDLVIYGHTHKVELRRTEKSVILNPGEACGWVTGKSTVAIVELESLQVVIREL